MLWQNTQSASNPALEAPLLPVSGAALSVPYASSLHLPVSTGTASSSPQTIAFIDANIADAALVMAGVQADLKVFLNPNQDGIAQITETLGHYQSLTGIEIISHGDAASLQLGGSFLSSLSLEQYAPQLQQWGNSLAAGADILFYGCDFAQDDWGKALVNQISQLTGADVAASIDLTGNANLGGNWTLEYTTGTIETASPFSAALMSTYQGLFANSSIFTPSATPSAINLNDGVTYELGMRFTSTKAGEIESIRFWKAPNETGTHVGKIWSSTGQLLGSVTFTNETASGWQQQSLTTPVSITAGTTYTVSVNTNGFYAATNGGLSSAITSGDITALAGGGMFGNAGTLPSQSYQNGNYFRDVVFAPTTTNIPGSITLSGTTSQGNTLTASVTDPNGLNGVTITYQWQQSSNGTTWTNVPGATSQTLALDSSLVGQQVRTNAIYTDALGASENVLSSATNPIAVVSPTQSLFTTQTPLQANATDGSGSAGDYELGMEFRSAKAGTIDAVRFYKAASETGTHVGKIWSSTGTLLASVTFTNETASGWQQQALTTPIAIAANTTYVVSVNANTHYVVTPNGIATTLTNGDISAIADGSNGLYNTTPANFPTQSYQNSNYFRDIVFTPTPSNPTNNPGSVALSGTLTQSQTLTATVTDQDGLAGNPVNYQWQQSSNGTTWTNIAGATNQTFTLTQTQVSQQVRARAIYSDALGSPETVFSNATTPVTNVNDLGIVAISGITSQGSTLSASVIDLDGLTAATVAYQWQQSSNGTTWTNIAGATVSSLTLDSTYIGKQVRVNASYVDTFGNSENISSDATNTIATSTTLFGTEAPARLDATDGSGSAGDYELGVEFRSARVGTISAIRYFKALSEIGSHVGRIWSSTGELLATVTFQNETASGWQQQALAAPLAIQANTTYVVSVNANTHYALTPNGLLTTVTNGDLSAVADGSNGVLNTTPNQFPTQSFQNSNYFRDVVFTPDAPAGPNNPGIISISGIASQNQLLTAVLSDQDGFVQGTSITYQWQQSNDNGTTWTDIINAGCAGLTNCGSCNCLLVGGTDRTLPLGQAQVGSQVRLKITYIDALGNSEVAISPSTAIVANVSDEGIATITGINAQGNTLTATVEDNDGLSGVNITYRWQQTSDGTTWADIVGETNQSLTLSSNLVGQQVRVNVIYTDALGGNENIFSPSTSPITAAAETQSLFTTQTPAQINENDGAGSAGDYELGMEFRSNAQGRINAIRYYKAPNETGGHVGRIWSATGQLLATVAFQNETASGWQQQALASPLTIQANATYIVSVNVNTHYVVTNNGLTVSLTNGNLTAVADGSNGVFNPTPGLLPTQSFQNANYFRDIVFTAFSSANNSVGVVSINGTPVQNQTLTANVTDADGLIGSTVGYQWQQLVNGVWLNITGATTQSFTLTQAQVNQQVRAKVTYTDGLGNTEIPISTATSSVVNVNDAGQTILAGSATVNASLLSNVLDTDGLTGVTIGYQWQQLVNSTWTNIAGATSKSLTLSSALLNQQVRSLATYIDSLGSSESVTSSAVSIAAQNAIVLENQKPGTTNWRISSNNQAIDQIEGYGDATSVNKGQAINFKISLAQAGQYTIDVYRLGYYGGDGGRLVTSITGLNGGLQANPTVNSTTNLVEYNWNTSYTLQTGTDWTSGLYFAKLTSTSTGKQNYIQFVVRDDDRPADIGFQDAITTAAAYNNNGGYSLYDFNSAGGQRAYQVSFDRPFRYGAAAGSEQFNNTLTWQYNMTRWLESQGYDISYYTNLDVHINPLQLYSQKTFLSSGHDEYWSMEMRNTVEQSRDYGTNLAFFSANSAYWRVRFESSSSGQANRVMTSYKGDWVLDPVAQADASQATTVFRSAEINRPENALLGVMYVGDWGASNVYNGFDHIVTNASDPYYAHTGLQNGDQLTGLIGYEWDAVVNNGFTPAGVVTLSQSPTQTQGGLPLLPAGTSSTIGNMVRYTAPSGAKVFSTGSIQWVWGLDSDGVPNPREDARAQQIAANVFKDMGATPQTPSSGIVV
jgi:Domain of unknown function (DUF4347)/Domain of unknown function (DUF4082)